MPRLVLSVPDSNFRQAKGGAMSRSRVVSSIVVLLGVIASLLVVSTRKAEAATPAAACPACSAAEADYRSAQDAVTAAQADVTAADRASDSAEEAVRAFIRNSGISTVRRQVEKTRDDVSQLKARSDELQTSLKAAIDDYAAFGEKISEFGEIVGELAAFVRDVDTGDVDLLEVVVHHAKETLEVIIQIAARYNLGRVAGIAIGALGVVEGLIALTIELTPAILFVLAGTATGLAVGITYLAAKKAVIQARAETALSELNAAKTKLTALETLLGSLQARLDALSAAADTAFAVLLKARDRLQEARKGLAAALAALQACNRQKCAPPPTTTTVPRTTTTVPRTTTTTVPSTTTTTVPPTLLDFSASAATVVGDPSQVQNPNLVITAGTGLTCTTNTNTQPSGLVITSMQCSAKYPSGTTVTVSGNNYSAIHGADLGFACQLGIGASATSFSLPAGGGSFVITDTASCAPR